MLQVKFENCKSSSFIEEDVWIFDSSVDGWRTTHARRIHVKIAHYGPSGQVS